MKQLMEMPTTMPLNSEGTRTTHDEDSEQSRGALPKNLIPPLPMQDVKAKGSEYLLSRS